MNNLPTLYSVSTKTSVLSLYAIKNHILHPH